MQDPSSALELTFIAVVLLTALSALMALAFGASQNHKPVKTWLRRGTFVVLGLLVFSGGLALSETLKDFSMPPKLMLMVTLILGVTAAFSCSRFGTGVVETVPLWLIIGISGFRLPLELTMHWAASEGVMPPQMSYSGYNFDIITGASALGVAAWLRRGNAPRWLVPAWNILGSVLLLTVVVIAIVSMPTPLRLFWQEPANEWVAHFPFVWLPGFLVPLALASHILVFRALMRKPESSVLGSSQATVEA